MVMTKKRLFIVLIAGVVLFTFFGFVSCNKEDDSVPTVTENLLPESSAPYQVCPYCGGKIYRGETHIHYYQPNEICTEEAACECFGTYHRHVVVYARPKFWHLGGAFHG